MLCMHGFTCPRPWGRGADNCHDFQHFMVDDAVDESLFITQIWIVMSILQVLNVDTSPDVNRLFDLFESSRRRFARRSSQLNDKVRTNFLHSVLTILTYGDRSIVTRWETRSE